MGDSPTQPQRPATHRDRRMNPDFMIIGGGIIGLTLARELRSRQPNARIRVIEKERDLGEHASGRNSGVLHAGFYYSADSLKARFARDGNRQLVDYCLTRGLPLNRCGKLVVARDETELAGLDELLRRGAANGVDVHDITVAEARALEPEAHTFERALWSPTTATVDPTAILRALARDLTAAGVQISRGTAYLGRGSNGAVRTSAGDVAAGYVVNAAGLQADSIAHDFGFAAHYHILPFKGVYLYGCGRLRLRRHVYPVPDLANPFLGVHFTVTVDDHTKIGPTAIPAFWREHYSGLSRFRWREFADVVWREATLFARNDFGFRSLALDEIRKYRRETLVRLAARLVPAAREDDFIQWGRPGIRAQLLDTRSRRMVMDFLHEGDDRSFHVLNAVSPGFTCAMPFAGHLVDEIERLTA